jgi:polysaccharide biosynthesis protein PslH
MKVLVVSTWFPFPPTNGVKLRAFHLLEALARAHRVTLLSFAHPDERPDPTAAALTSLCERIEVVPGSPVLGRVERVRDWFSPLPRSLAASYQPLMQTAVDRCVAHHDAAIALTPWSAPYLLPRRSRPRVLDELELTMLAENRRSGGLSRLRHELTWWKQARFARQLTDEFDRVTVVSESERVTAESAGCDPSRLAVVPNAVRSTLLERPAARFTPGRLVYPGAITYAPNDDAVRFAATEILPLVRQTHPHATLVVTGSTGGAEIDDLTRQYALTFTGFVDDVAREIEASELCVVPLRVGGGTRLKILEALALGVPVVSTAKGAEGLDVHHERELLVADTPEAFAQQVRRVLDDSELRRRLIAAGRRAVAEHYTWDVVGRLVDDTLSAARASWEARVCVSA